MNAFSLFSGCGGCSLGLMQAGFDVRLAVDIDRQACETYARSLGEKAIWQVDLLGIQPEQMLEKAQIGQSEVDLIVGGPPCQGFSSAGAKDWTDPRNKLLRNFIEIVTKLRPTWFVMENVEGLLTAQDGFYITEAVTRFLSAGYWVSARKLYLEKYGLPQRRKRVLIIGNLEQCEFRFPAPAYFEPPFLPLTGQQAQRTILDAIGDLPPAMEAEIAIYPQPPKNDYQLALQRQDGCGVSLHQSKPLNDLLRKRIERLAPGETMKDLPPELQHSSFTRRAFRRVMDGTPTEKRGGAPSGLKRMHSDKPSLTITSASPTEFIHPIKNRPLTLRECARIQSFPDWFEFSGSFGAIATQIGNAIPPLLMKILATQINELATWRKANKPQGRWLGIEATKSEGMSPALTRTLQQIQEKTYAYV